MELLAVALRSLIVYLFILAAIRVFGKREITQLSVTDLVFILLISNAVQNAMVGPNTSLLGGLVAACTLFAANRLLEFLSYRSKSINSLLQGDALMLIYKGKVLTSHLQKASISRVELEVVVREHGIADINDVDLAVLETDGNISIISDNYQHRSIKKRKGNKVLHR